MLMSTTCGAVVDWAALPTDREHRIRRRLMRWIATVAVGAVAAAGFNIDLGVSSLRIADNTGIDAYPAWTSPTRCAKPLVSKPGVADFRALILSQVGGADDGLEACKLIANRSGSLSDHADGRAWDWRMNARNSTDRATVEKVFDWLLRTDQQGNRNAMARRLGITYIIWNHRYYRVNDDDAAWSLTRARAIRMMATFTSRSRWLERR